MKKVIKKRVLPILITIMMIASFFGTASASSDLNGHWAEAEIKEWVQKGLVKGFPDGTFKPNATITRAEFFTLINRSFGFEGKGTGGFKDISTDDWFYGEILKAKAAGYLDGYEDGTVRPLAPISRQEEAAILARLLKLTDAPKAAAAFKDQHEIPAWSKGVIGSVSEKGFMVGFKDGTFKPFKKLTRAEAIVSLNRVIHSELFQTMYTAATYDKAGTYGPASGTETIKGNVSISAADVTLRNTIIDGNLTIEKSVGNGEVYLKGVTVKGKTIVNGGGENSIHFEDSVLVTVIVNKVDGTVRIVASGKTTVQQVELQSSAKVEEANATGSAFQTVTLAASLPANSKVALIGDFDSVEVKATTVRVSIPKGSIKNLRVDENAKGTSIDVDREARIVSLIVNAAIQVLGLGKIESATINVNGTSFQQQPDHLKLADGVTANTPGNSGGSGGSNGSGGTGGNAGGGSGDGTGGGPGNGTGDGSGDGTGNGNGEDPKPDTAAPEWTAGEVRISKEGMFIVLTFNEPIISHVAELKEGIHMSINDREFQPLLEEDSVSIGVAFEGEDHRNRLIIQLSQVSDIFDKVKVKILGNTLKDEAGNVQTNDVVTGSMGIAQMEMTTVFENRGMIPEKYSHLRGNVSLPVSWTPVEGAKSYLLLMFDQDAYTGGDVYIASMTEGIGMDNIAELGTETGADMGIDPGAGTTVPDFYPGYFQHWFVKNIPGNVTSIEEGMSGKDGMVGVEFKNGFGEEGYGGPEPPMPHQYVLYVFALDVPTIELEDDGMGIFSPERFIDVVFEHVIGVGMIEGMYGPDVDGQSSTVSPAVIHAAVEEEFTFEINVRNDSENHSIIWGLREYDFDIEAIDGDGYLDINSVEEKEPGVYTVTAAYDTEETVQIRVSVRGVELTQQVTLTVVKPLSITASTYDYDVDGVIDELLILVGVPVKSDSIQFEKFLINGEPAIGVKESGGVDDRWFWIVFREEQGLKTDSLPEVTVQEGAFTDMDGNVFDGRYTMEVMDFAAPTAVTGAINTAEQVEFLFSEAVQTAEIVEETLNVNGSHIEFALSEDNSSGIVTLSNPATDQVSFQFVLTDPAGNDLEYTATYTNGHWQISWY